MVITKKGKEMSGSPNYPELVAKAEAAVTSVKDPELKRIAFQKILDDLLSGTAGTAKHPKEKEAPLKASRPAAKGKASPKSGPQAYIEELVGEKYFENPKTIANVKAELENRGHHIPLTSLSGPLQALCQRRRLRRQKIASGNKQSFAYSEW
jgi:hypothetical protein